MCEVGVKGVGVRKVGGSCADAKVEGSRVADTYAMILGIISRGKPQKIAKWASRRERVGVVYRARGSKTVNMKRGMGGRMVVIMIVCI